MSAFKKGLDINGLTFYVSSFDFQTLQWQGGKMDYPQIDNSRCTKCRRCVEICPKGTLALGRDGVELTGQECILCTQCYCVCPAGVFTFGPPIRALSFKSFPYREKVLKTGVIKPGDLVNYVRSRRSVRRYSERPVSDSVARDLVEFAVTAPSGSNCQKWEFLVINGRDRVEQIGAHFAGFFRTLNRLAGNRVFRMLSFFFAGMTLIRYYRERYDSVEKALREAAGGRDMLFWGAPCVIIVHGPMEGSLPAEDGQYAAYNIAMMAPSLGLGTCFIGYASETLNRAGKLKARCGIPASHRVHAVLAAGYPAVAYRNLALRKDYPVMFA